ncbi:MAG: NAD(P)/FAD-dependent oxidoreductase [Dysosmobacter welbionis]
MIDAKPHVGTDYLHTVLVNLRRRLLELGTDIRFESRLADLDIRDGPAGHHRGGPEGVYTLPCSHLLLCPGHSARDTFAMLHKRGVPMEAKPFAVGVRIEHRQADCDAAQYRQYAGHPGLPASTYKLSCHLPGGRAAYSFCVCPGGEVVAAASEAERVVTNGMSEFARDKENINGGLLVNVTPEDYGGRKIPWRVSPSSGSWSLQPTLWGWGLPGPGPAGGDFLAGRPSVGPGRVHPSYRPGVTWTDLRRCLPPFVADTIAGALPTGAEAPGLRRSGRRPDGGGEPFLLPSAHPTGWDLPVLSPGPVPRGEGAGYAGGILSAAADGMHCAEQLCQSIQKESDCL